MDCREGPVYKGQIARFLDQIALDFNTLHSRVQVHMGGQFSLSADLVGTMHQITSGETHRCRYSENHGLDRDLTRRSLRVFHGGTLTDERFRDYILDQ